MPAIRLDRVLFARLKKIAESAGYDSAEAFAIQAIEKELAIVEAGLRRQQEPTRSAEDILEALREIRKRTRPGSSIRELINEGRRFQCRVAAVAMRC